MSACNGFARLLALVLTMIAPVAAQSEPLSPAQVAAIDAAADKALKSSGAPAASIAVVRNGAIVYAKAYGMQRDGVPARADARYPIGSVSKQFTAAAILILADEGKLSLDDRVDKYLPGLTRANEVTIRQLLSHTSGYRDYWPQDYAFADMYRPTTPQAILDRWAKAPLDFEPGTRWQYSNTGYVAAGLIAEKVSGMPLVDFLRRRVFARLGMAPVDMDTGLTAADPQGYGRDALGPVRPKRPTGANWAFAAGELAMTASDLARWDIAMIDRTAMSPAAYAEMEREVLLASGLGTSYGLGVGIRNARGRRLIAHGGEVEGFLTENRVYPDERAAIVVLSNGQFGDADTAIANAVEEQLFSVESGVARARALYAMLRSGQVDRSRFTANGNGYLTSTVLADYRDSLAPLGEPKAIRQVQAGLRGGFTSEAFVVEFADRKLEIVLRAEPGADGKVEQFTVTPAS